MQTDQPSDADFYDEEMSEGPPESSHAAYSQGSQNGFSGNHENTEIAPRGDVEMEDPPLLSQAPHTRGSNRTCSNFPSPVQIGFFLAVWAV